MKRIKERVQTYEFNNAEVAIDSKLERLVSAIKTIKSEHLQVQQRLDEISNILNTFKTEQLQVINTKIEELSNGLNDTLENISKVLESHKKAIDSLVNVNVDI